ARSSGRRTASRSTPREAAASNQPARRGSRRAPRACGADCPAFSIGRLPEGRSTTTRFWTATAPAQKSKGAIASRRAPTGDDEWRRVVAGGEFLDDFYIRGETG